MANARVRMNDAEIKKLLKSPEVLADLERRARAVAAIAGDGMEVDSGVGPTRARASVRTASIRAMRREARDRILLRALDAGRQ